MSIIRTCHNRENPYITVNKIPIEDPNLSWAAKGLWTYLMGRPDNWNVSVKHLQGVFGKPGKKGSNRDAILGLLNELIENGYCSRVQVKEKGKIIGCEYTVYEFKTKVPQTPQPDTAQPDTDKALHNKERSSLECPTPKIDIPHEKMKNDIIDRATSPFIHSNGDIASLCLESFRLGDGRLLSGRTLNAFRKYLTSNPVRLLSNIEYYQRKCAENYSIKDHERFLQYCLNKDLASKENDKSHNLLYAKFVQSDLGLFNEIQILKTVIQLIRDGGRDPITLDLLLPHSSFCNVLDNFVRNNIANKQIGN